MYSYSIIKGLLGGLHKAPFWSSESFPFLDHSPSWGMTFLPFFAAAFLFHIRILQKGDFFFPYCKLVEEFHSQEVLSASPDLS